MGSNIQTRRIRTVSSKHNIATKSPSRTNQLVDVSHQTAKEQLIPMARQMTRNAITVDRREIFYYFKKTLGRECTCVQENNTPSGYCPICYKVGWVGGFDKFGTVTEILDTTMPFSTCNLVLNYINRPCTLELDKDSLYGYAIWKFEVKQNIRILDLLQIIDYQEFGKIHYFILDGSTWVDLTEDNIKQQLSEKTITIKAEMSRTNLNLVSPKFTCIRIRYNVRDTLLVNSDWNHTKDSRVLSEYGIMSNWQSASVNIDDIIPVIRPEDWVYRSDRNERWKIIEVDKFDQLQLTTGFDITLRLIQPHEIYTRVTL